MICPNKGIECSTADLSVRLVLSGNSERAEYAQVTEPKAVEALGAYCARMETELSDIWPSSVTPDACPVVNSAAYEVQV